MTDAGGSERRPERLQVVLAEFGALRQEIQNRSGAAWTLLNLNLTASTAVAGFVLSSKADPLLLLLMPFLSPALGLLFLDHGINIQHLGTYIQRELKPRAVEAGGDAELLAYEDRIDEYERDRVGRFLIFAWPITLVFLISATAGLAFSWDHLHRPGTRILWAVALVNTCVYLVFWGRFIVLPFVRRVRAGPDEPDTAGRRDIAAGAGRGGSHVAAAGAVMAPATLPVGSPDPSELFELGRRSLEELRSPYGFSASDAAGLYEALFGRDSLWMLLFLLEAERLAPARGLEGMVREAGSSILGSLARVQGTRELDVNEEQPGKIVHEYHDPSQPLPDRVARSGLGFDDGRSYAGFDQTFLFVTAYRRYRDRYPDDPIGERLWPNIERAIGWIDRYGDENGDGLFEHRRRHPSNLLHQVWKDSFDAATHTGFDLPPEPLAWIEVQGYGVQALEDAAALYGARGRHEDAERWARRAGDLRAAIEDRFWLPEPGEFAMAIDGEGRPVTMPASNPGHLLWAGAVGRERTSQVVERLTRPDLSSPFGIRTLASTSPFHAPYAYHRGAVWPFDNAVIASGLLRAGRSDAAHTVMERVGRALLAIGSPVELYVVLDEELFVRPPVHGAALTIRRVAEQAGGRRSPENATQGWTAAALVLFGAALSDRPEADVHG